MMILFYPYFAVISEQSPLSYIVTCINLVSTLIYLSELRLRNGQLHPGAICGGCYQQIYGVIHQCLVCPDYCLCSECKDSDVHKEHNMVGRQSPYGARYSLGMFSEVAY